MGFLSLCHPFTSGVRKLSFRYFLRRCLLPSRSRRHWRRLPLVTIRFRDASPSKSDYFQVIFHAAISRSTSIRAWVLKKRPPAGTLTRKIKVADTKMIETLLRLFGTSIKIRFINESFHRANRIKPGTFEVKENAPNSNPISKIHLLTKWRAMGHLNFSQNMCFPRFIIECQVLRCWGK